MKTFVVSGTITISTMTKVKAETAEEAKEIAAERMNADLCHQCATGHPFEEWVIDELDGEVEINGVEEA